MSAAECSIYYEEGTFVSAMCSSRAVMTWSHRLQPLNFTPRHWTLGPGTHRKCRSRKFYPLLRRRSVERRVPSCLPHGSHRDIDALIASTFSLYRTLLGVHGAVIQHDAFRFPPFFQDAADRRRPAVIEFCGSLTSPRSFQSSNKFRRQTVSTRSGQCSAPIVSRRAPSHDGH